MREHVRGSFSGGASKLADLHQRPQAALKELLHAAARLAWEAGHAKRKMILLNSLT
jgi:hypothetical protein